MLPLVLDLARLPVALVGSGAPALARLRRLDAAGAGDLTVWSPTPIPALAAEAGDRLRRRWPNAAELAAARLVVLAGLDRDRARNFAGAARRAGRLVHAEDMPEISDLHAPAALRRGDLLLAVSTGGRSPGLARRICAWLAARFGAEWQDRLDDIARRRAAWREAGASPGEIAAWTDCWIERAGWLDAGPANDIASSTLREISHGTATG